jgi:hypothetical protein
MLEKNISTLANATQVSDVAHGPLVKFIFCCCSFFIIIFIFRIPAYVNA